MSSPPGASVVPTDASVEEPAAEAKQGPGEGEQGEFGQATDGDSPPTPPRHSSSSGREDGCDVGRGVGRGVVARRSVGRTRRTSSQSAVALPRPAARVDTDDSSGRSSAEEDALTPLMHGPELVAAAEERRQQRRRSLDSVGGMSAPYAPSAADHPNGADGESDSIYSHRVSAAGDGMEGGEGAEFGTSPLQRPALPPPAAPVEPGVAAEDCHLIADAGSAASASARPALAPTAGSRHSTEGKQRDANAGADAAARRGEGSTAHRHRNRHRRPRAQGSPTSDTRSSSQGSSAKAAHAGLPAQAELPGPQAGTVASAAAAAAAYAQIALSAQAGAPCPLYVRDASGRFVPVSSLHGQAFAAGQRDLPPASMAAGRRRRRDGKLRSSEQASLGGGGASTGGMSTHGSEEAETMSQGRWDTGSGVGRSRAMEHARPATELSPAGPDHSADRGSGSESGSMHPRGSRLASFASWLSAKPAPARPRPRPQIRTATQLMDAKRAQLRAGHAQAVVGSVGGSPPRPMHQDSLSSNEQAPESVGGGRSGGGSAVEAGRRWRTRLHSTHSHATLVTRRTESDLDARQPEWSSQKQGGSFFALAPPVVHGPTPAPSDARTASREERLAAAVRHGVKRTLSSRSSVPLAGLAAAEGAAAGAGAGGEGSPPFAPEASTPVDEAGPLATAQLPPASSSTAVAATAIDTTAAPVAVAAAHAGSATSSNAATDAAVVASTPTSAAAAAAAGGDRASDRWRNASGSVRGTYAEEEKGSAVEGGGEVGGRPGQGSRPAPIRRASSTTALPTGSRIQGVGSARARAAPGQSPDMGVSPGREEGVRRTASGEDEGCRGSESSATAQATASLASRAGDSGPIRKVTTDALQRAAASERRLSAGGADSPARARRRASRNLTAQELAEVMAEAVAPGSPMLRGQNGEQRGSPARERRGSSSVQSPPLKEEEEEEEGGSDGSVDRERGSIGTCVRRSSVSPGLVDEAHVLRIAPRRQSLARHSVMRRASRRVGELFGRFGTLRGGSGDQIGPFRMRRRSSVGKANNEGEDDAEGKGDNGTGAPPVRQLPCLMIHPHSSKRIAWDMLLLTLLVYVSLTIPFRLGFDSPATGGWRLLETMTDFTFLTDVMMNFRTAYVDPDGKLHTRQRTIATHYLRGWFAIDIVSSIPFDLVMDASAGEDDLSSIKVLKVGRVLRTLRAAKLLKLTRFLKVGHLMERLEDEFAVNRNMLGIVKLLLFTAMLCHVNACLYHFIAVLQESAESWTMQGDDPLPQTKVESYVLAFYWSVATLSTVGYGDVRAHTTAERVYATTAMLMGGGYFGYVIAKFSLLVTNLNAHNKIYREKMEAISAYMKNRKLPRELQGRIRRYYRHYLEQRTAFDEAEILNELNTFLRQEVAMHLTHETIYNIPLFEGRDPHFLAQLLTILKPLTASADDLLVQHGERGREMFILIRGTLAVEDRVGDVTRTLRKGDFFGELCALGLQPLRTATVRVVSDCELYSLSRADLQRTFQHEPEVLAEMRQVVRAMYGLEGPGEEVTDGSYNSGTLHVKTDPEIASMLSQHHSLGHMPPIAMGPHIARGSGSDAHVLEPTPADLDDKGIGHPTESHASPGHGEGYGSGSSSRSSSGGGDGGGQSGSQRRVQSRQGEESKDAAAMMPGPVDTTPVRPTRRREASLLSSSNHPTPMAVDAAPLEYSSGEAGGSSSGGNRRRWGTPQHAVTGGFLASAGTAHDGDATAPTSSDTQEQGPAPSRERNASMVATTDRGSRRRRPSALHTRAGPSPRADRAVDSPRTAVERAAEAAGHADLPATVLGGDEHPHLPAEGSGEERLRMWQQRWSAAWNQ